METCSKCLTTVRSGKYLVKHLYFIHNIHLGNTCLYTCFGCKRTYDNVKSFRKHKCNSEIKRQKTSTLILPVDKYANANNSTNDAIVTETFSNPNSFIFQKRTSFFKLFSFYLSLCTAC